jgi:hypothetical protein
MKKERIFRELLEKYIGAVVNVTDKASAMQQADDIRDAWVSRYQKADEGINQQLKRFNHESKV